jgi:hypothetical protein
MAVPITFVALIARRARRQLSTAGAYREVAQALGLNVDTRGVSLHGVRDGRTLWVGEVLVGEGPERRTEVHGVVGLRRPLALGLELRRKAHRREVALPVPADLERALVAYSAWPDGLHRLWTGEVIEALRGLAERCPDLRISDAHVRVRMTRPPAHVAGLGSLVEQLEGVAAALEGARAAGPPAPATDAWLASWMDLADRYRLAIAPALPALSGALAGWPCEIGPVVRGGAWCARIAVHFSPDEDTGLRVGPQRPGVATVVGQDIRVGDPAFDQAFVIKGHDPEAVRDRLNAQVRGDLLALAALGEVSLDDHRLVVEGLNPAAHALERGLDLTERLVERLNQRVPRGGTPAMVRPRPVDV